MVGAVERRMLIRCRPRRRHQKGLASGLVTSYECVSPPTSPLFECAIVPGYRRDDDERNLSFFLLFFFSLHLERGFVRTEGGG